MRRNGYARYFYVCKSIISNRQNVIYILIVHILGCCRDCATTRTENDGLPFHKAVVYHFERFVSSIDGNVIQLARRKCANADFGKFFGNIYAFEASVVKRLVAYRRYLAVCTERYGCDV